MAAIFNFVDDFGASPDGETNSDGALAALAGYGGPVECVIPEGEYHFSATEHVVAPPRATLRAENNADVTFVAPAGYAGPWLSFGGEITLEGITIDQTAYGAGPQLRLETQTVARCNGVEVIGRDDSESNGALLTVAPLRASASVRIDGFEATRGAAAPETGPGRAGIYVDPDSKGTVSVDDSHLRAFSREGIDAGDAAGPLIVRDSYLANNDNAQIRAGSGDTRLTSTVCLVDPARSRIPPSEIPAHFSNAAGVRIETLNPGTEPTRIVDCAIATRSGTAQQVDPTILADAGSGRVRIRDTAVTVDVDGTPGLLAEAPLTKPNGITVSNTGFVGAARSGAAITIHGRPETTIAECQVETPGTRRAMDLPSDAVVENVDVATRTW